MKKLLEFRNNIFIRFVDWTKPVYAKWFPHPEMIWPYDKDSLKRFPEGSLGNDLGHWLCTEGLDLMPQFESHDVYHVLLNYETTVIDEARMQFFLLGNGKRSLYIIGTIIIALFFIPEKWVAFRKEYKLGKACPKVSRWNFLFLLKEPTIALQNLVFEKRTKNIPFII